MGRLSPDSGRGPEGHPPLPCSPSASSNMVPTNSGSELSSPGTGRCCSSPAGLSARPCVLEGSGSVSRRRVLLRTRCAGFQSSLPWLCGAGEADTRRQAISTTWKRAVQWRWVLHTPVRSALHSVPESLILVRGHCTVGSPRPSPHRPTLPGNHAPAFCLHGFTALGLLCALDLTMCDLWQGLFSLSMCL